MQRISRIIPDGNTNDFKLKSQEWANQFEVVVFLESNLEEQTEKQKYYGFDAVLAIGSHKLISSDYKDSFSKLTKFQSDCNDYLFGYLGYDLKNDVEDLSSENADYVGFSDLYFFQPKKIILWKNDQALCLYLDEYSKDIESDIQAIRQTEIKKAATNIEVDILSRISRPAYFKKVENILEHIHRGDIYEVNFCQEFFANNTEIDPLAVYQKLNEISSAPFASFLKIEDKFLLSASPERFVKKQGPKIVVQPIKGTARRIEETTEDQLVAETLSNDPKERAENIMIVDLIRNDLSKHAKKGSVQVEELCKVYSFKQVHQLISTVTCDVLDQVHPVEILKDLFPMGSMTGAPKISAMKIIEEEEETKRGLYSGAVGYFTADGDFDFNVVIRSILYNASSKYISFSVGSAITSLSEIEKEYQECLLKARALKQAIRG